MIDLAPLARELADAPAIAADPRPGTRSLSDTALGSLGIELLRCEPDLVAARMPVRDPTAARGMLLVLAETAASTAAGLRTGPARRAFGAELNASFVASPATGQVVAIAVPSAITDTLHVWRIVAFDDSEAQVLEARCTLGVVRAPS